VTGEGEKMNFVGGEPTLHPDIDQLVLAAKEMGFTTSIVSNGARLARLLASPAGAVLDWVGLSIDSATDEGNALVGRGGEDRRVLGDRLEAHRGAGAPRRTCPRARRAEARRRG
jgi:MoaA/NifB/PqqE/SkfB family radical SAM enzyme